MSRLLAALWLPRAAAHSTRIVGLVAMVVLAPAAPSLRAQAPVAAAPVWLVESDQAGARLGESVASAGDVNGDGYDDVILGVRLWDAAGLTNSGGAFLYLGGPGGPSTTASWSVAGAVAGYVLGSSAASAGDVNNDGYDDVIVGEPNNANGFAYVYHGSATGLGTTPATILEAGGTQYYRFGGIVASAGDINGDGYDDVVVAANNDNFASKWSVAYYGSAAGVISTPIWSYNHHPLEDYVSTYAAGDFDDDGFDDLAIGTTGSSSQVFYSTGAAGLSSVPVEHSEIPRAYRKVATGDVNGDGIDDLIVGAPAQSHDDTGGLGGAIYAYFGSASGLSPTIGWSGFSDIPWIRSRFGVSVAIGDFDNDGIDDVLAGHEGLESRPGQSPRVVVFRGGPTGPSTTIDWVGFSHLLPGADDNTAFGFSVGAGDFDGDGAADVLAGEPAFTSYYPGNHFEGRVVVYLGQSVVTTVDVTARVVDQFGTDLGALTNAQISLSGVGTVTSGGSFTVEPGTYNATLTLYSGNLFRDLTGVVISETTNTLAFEWITETMTVRLVDQHDNELPAGWVPTIDLPGDTTLSGGTLTAPILDATVYPDIRATGYASGYKFTNTLFSGNLAYDVLGVVVTQTTDAIDFEWRTVSGPLLVVDATGTCLTGSTWQLPGAIGGAGSSGDVVTMPIIDDSVYPTIRLNYVDGYPVTLNPNTTPGSGSFRFDFLDNQIIDPDFETIDGQSFGLRFDAERPIVTITSPVDQDVVGTTTVTLAATVADCSATTASSTPAEITASLPAGGGNASGLFVLVEGANLISVSATDAANLTGGTSVSVIRDTIDPGVTICSPAPNTVFGASPVTLTIDVTDATATSVAFGANSISLAAGGGQVSGPVDLVEGSNTITVTVADAAGNDTDVPITLILDLSAPLVTIDSPANGACFGPGDEMIGVSATIDDLTATAVSSTPTGVSGSLPVGGGIANGVVTLSEGSNAIAVNATDAANLTGSGSITVILDTTEPSVTVTSPGNGDAVSGTIDVDANIVEPPPGSGVAQVTFSIDGGAPIATLTAAPFGILVDTGTLSDGPHTLTVRATDGKGNADEATVAVFVDNTPPVIVIANPVAAAYVAGSMVIDVNAADGGSGLVAVEVLADGDPPTGDPSAAYPTSVAAVMVSGSEDTTLRADGPLSVTARAVDDAGNETTVDVVVTIDNTAPAKTLTAPVDGETVDGTISVTATATDTNLASIAIEVDGQSSGSSTTSPLTVDVDSTARLDGAMSIEVIVTDLAGNRSTCAATVTVNNMTGRLIPKQLNLKAAKAKGDVKVELTGSNLALLLPTEDHAIELHVPGGSPIPSVQGWGGDDQIESGKLMIRFDRQALVNALLAGIANGAIQPNSTVPFEVVAEGDVIETILVSIKGP